MKIQYPAHINGRVAVRNEVGERLSAAGLEVRLTPSTGQALDSVRLGWSGEFHFMVREATREALRVSVTSSSGEELYQQHAYPRSHTSAWDRAPASALRHLELPVLIPDGDPALHPLKLPEDFREKILAAADALGIRDGESEEKLDGWLCDLPPLMAVPATIQFVVEGTLAGNAADRATLADLVTNVAAWQRARYPHYRSEATAPDYIDKLLHGRDRRLAVNGMRTVEQAGRTKLILAVASVTGPETSSILAGFELLQNQVSLYREYERLGEVAEAVLAGRPFADTIYRAAFSAIGLFCVQWRGGSQIPLPDSPIPDRIGTGIVEECDIRAITEYIREGRDDTYLIEEVSPADACPGELLTIRGKRLSYRGSGQGVVTFTGLAFGSSVVSIPERWTSTEMTVRVPEGAACGPMELLSDGSSTIDTCDAEIDVFKAAGGRPYYFMGGVTHLRTFAVKESNCLRGGDEITVEWSACSAERFLLTVTESDPDGVELDRKTFFGPQGSHPGGSRRIQEFMLTRRPTSWSLRLEIVVEGRCGRDGAEAVYGVAGTALVAPPALSTRRFENWHGNVQFPAVTAVVPRSVAQTIASVTLAESRGLRVAPVGSEWSFTDCSLSEAGQELLVDTSALAGVEDGIVARAILDEPMSVMPAAARARLEAVTGPLPSTRDRLIHVGGGTKIHDLNCILARLGTPLALPTMGGSNGQAIAGAVSTGVHGSNVLMPPIADYVRAIHLVGSGGREWWLERESTPVTDAEMLSDLSRTARISPCLSVVRSDDTFDAALVSLGAAGVIVGVVLEAVPAHRLRTTTRKVDWSLAKSELETVVTAGDSDQPWFFEISVNPTRACWITRREPVAEPLTSVGDDAGMTPGEELSAVLLGGAAAFGLGVAPAAVGLLAGLLGAIPAWYQLKWIEFTAVLGNPFEWGRLQGIVEEFDRMTRALDILVKTFDALIGGDDDRIASVLPDALQVLWEIDLGVIRGRDILDVVQNFFTQTLRPVGTRVQESYSAYTGQADCLDPRYSSPYPPAPPQPRDGAIIRLIRSHEYAVAADRVAAFVDDLMSVADSARQRSSAIVMILNIRLTRRTRAFIGAQQFPLTGHVEIFLVSGLEGNEVVEQEIHDVVLRYGALPHWGQIHESDPAYLNGFQRLPRWRRAMDRLSKSEDGVARDTFVRAFVRRAGLLP